MDCAGKEGKEQEQRKYAELSLQSQPCSPVWRSQLGEEHPLHNYPQLVISGTALLACHWWNSYEWEMTLCLYHPLNISPAPWIECPSSFAFYILLPTTVWWAIQKHCVHHLGVLLQHPQQLSSKSFKQSFWSYLGKLFLGAPNFSQIVLVSILQITFPASNSLKFPAWESLLASILSIPILFFF